MSDSATLIHIKELSRQSKVLNFYSVQKYTQMTTDHLDSELRCLIDEGKIKCVQYADNVPYRFHLMA